MAIEELRAMDVGECLGRRAPHHYDTAFVPRKNGCCGEMGNLRRAAKNHRHTVPADASVASVAVPRIFRSGRNFSACDRAGTHQQRVLSASHLFLLLKSNNSVESRTKTRSHLMAHGSAQIWELAR